MTPPSELELPAEILSKSEISLFKWNFPSDWNLLSSAKCGVWNLADTCQCSRIQVKKIALVTTPVRRWVRYYSFGQWRLMPRWRRGPSRPCWRWLRWAGRTWWSEGQLCSSAYTGRWWVVRRPCRFKRKQSFHTQTIHPQGERRLRLWASGPLLFQTW